MENLQCTEYCRSGILGMKCCNANSKRPFMLLLREIVKRNAQLSRSISNVLVVSGHQVSCLVSWDKFNVAHESLGPF